MERTRRQTMRSFTWTPSNDDEISSCPDCTHWHALFEVEEIQEVGATVVTVREWHEVDCPIWTEANG
jgi:hypothetical protein